MKNQEFESSMRDWSRDERLAFIRSIPAPKYHRDVELAAGLSARGLIGRDVSILDRRSVKAQLAGRGDFRAAWWELNQRLHAFINPGATLEQMMYSFHRRHQAVTLFFAEIGHEYRTLLNLIRTDGTGAALRYSMSRTRDAGAER